jgi:hypothetical protein
MKNMQRLFGIIALVAIIGFSFIACDNGDAGDDSGNPQTVTYTGASGGTTYALKITENTARYAAQSGDTYELTVGSKKSTGTVSNVSGFDLTLKPSNASTTFTAAVSGSSLTALNGTVTWIDNATENAPGVLTPNGGTDITTVPGADLAAKLQWLKTNAANNKNYTVEVNKDEVIAGHTFNAANMNNAASATVTLKGIGSERKIAATGGGTVFTVASGYSLTLDININVTQGAGGSGCLIAIESGATLVMKDGAKITNGQSGLWGGGVGVWGTFTMNGGEISGNDGGSGHGGGVAVHGGTFTMNGGTIKNNQSNFPTGGGGGGGGVLVNSGTFTMNGGIISGNETDGRGGGVCNGGTFDMNGGTVSGNQARYGGGVDASNGTFTMKGGEISGNTATGEGGGVIVSYNGEFIKTAEGGVIYGTGDPKANTASQGQAVCLWYSSAINDGGYRNTTVTANERLTASNGSKGEGTWGE